MAYKYIGGAPKGIAGFPKDDWVYPDEIITEPAQIEFIEGMNEVNRNELFEKIDTGISYPMHEEG
jgi:hypothetical protein